MRKIAWSIAFLLIVCMSINALAAPKISTVGITPREGLPSTEFVFSLRYVGDVTPDSIEVIINEESFQMLAVDNTDLNYSDGKDFYFKTKLPAGVTIYHFKVTVVGDELRSTAYTVSVENLFELRHLDIALAVGIVGIVFLIPVIYLMIIMRRISKDIRMFVEEVKYPSEKPDDNSDNS